MEGCSFQRERQIFEARAWGEEDRGKFCLIIDDKIELFESSGQALEAGLARAYGAPFFLRRIHPRRPRLRVPCLFGLPESHSQSLPDAPPPIETTALLDTGSGRSSVAISLIKQLPLIQVDYGSLTTGQGQTRWPIFWAAVKIDASSLEGLFYGNTSQQLSTPVILGMDVLRHGDLISRFSSKEFSLNFPDGLIEID